MYMYICIYLYLFYGLYRTIILCCGNYNVYTSINPVKMNNFILILFFLYLSQRSEISFKKIPWNLSKSSLSLILTET